MAQPDTVDAAWDAAEAALPDGWWIALRGLPDTAYVASAAEDRYADEHPDVEAEGLTAASALRSLAAKLRDIAD